MIENKDQDEPIIECIFFDGKKDDSLRMIKKGSKFSKTCIEEEHYTVLQEPGSKYLTHLTPESSRAESVSQSILSFLNGQNMDLKAVGCDGTVVNTGHKGGIVARKRYNGWCVNYMRMSCH